jgi:hypothetical protein
VPDLDLIKQAELGCGRLGKADPSISSGSAKTATNAGDLLLICCRSSKRLSDAQIMVVGRHACLVLAST